VKEKSYPRVLVISGEPFNYESATGITISNLFKGWPKDRIAQIYSAKIKPNLDICDNIWQFSNTELLFIAQCMRLTRKDTPSYNNNNKMENRIRVTIRPKRSVIRKWLTPWIDLIPYHISAKFIQWIEEFKPELIYSTLGSIRMVNTVQRISRHLSIPVVPHFMDDWLSTYSVNGKSILTSIQRSIARNMTTRLVKDVHFGLGICDDMATEYSQRYQRNFFSFMNPVEVIPDYTVSKRGVTGTCSQVRFVYIGGLHLSRYKNLKDIGNVISGLHKEGHNIQLHIYAPSRDIMQYGSFLTIDNSVQVCGTLSSNDIHKTLCEYDVAVHVESFSKKRALFTRLSLSTKIPQYLAAGLPVLAYGPADVASCRYVSDYECGYVVGKRDSIALVNAIHDLASSLELRLQLGRNSWNVASERHEIHKEQERFRKKLLEVTTENAV
jgi:glycosyltransferase involved in cell wall biosynthesis